MEFYLDIYLHFAGFACALIRISEPYVRKNLILSIQQTCCQKKRDKTQKAISLKNTSGLSQAEARKILRRRQEELIEKNRMDLLKRAEFSKESLCSFLNSAVNIEFVYIILVGINRFLDN